MSFTGIQKRLTLKEAFQLGLDCGMNGATEKNCDFRIFATPELTKEWERGNNLGLQHARAEQEYLDRTSDNIRRCLQRNVDTTTLT